MTYGPNRGAGVDAVCDALSRNGVVEPHALCKATGLSRASIEGAIRKAKARGEAVQFSRGLWARPDVAAAMHEAIERANARKMEAESDGRS